MRPRPTRSGARPTATASRCSTRTRSTGYDYNSIAGEPWNTADGGNTDFRAPYVGYSPNAALFKTVGVSAYDALETHLEKRLSHNFQVGASYTFSHTYDEQSDIGMFFTGDNPNNLQRFVCAVPTSTAPMSSAPISRCWLPTLPGQIQRLPISPTTGHLSGIGILQSGEPYSLYEFYGAVGSIYFGDFPTLMNPVLPIKDPKQSQECVDREHGRIPRDRRQLHSGHRSLPRSTSITSQPGQKGVPISTGTDPQDIYETDFAPGQRKSSARLPEAAGSFPPQEFPGREKVQPAVCVQYLQHNQHNQPGCAAEPDADPPELRLLQLLRLPKGNNCSPGQYYFVNYGQIVTSPSPRPTSSPH